MAAWRRSRRQAALQAEKHQVPTVAVLNVFMVVPPRATRRTSSGKPMGAAAHRCQRRAPPSGLLAPGQVVFMGELPAADEVIGLYPYFVGESNAQPEAMVGVAPLWAVLAAEEQGTPITTEAQAWRRRHLAVAEEEERRRLEDYWREQARARQTAASAQRRREHTPRPRNRQGSELLVGRIREGIPLDGERNLQEYASQRAQVWRANMTEWMEHSQASGVSRRG